MDSESQKQPVDWRLIGVLIGVIGLGRAALGVQLYPYGDDMVYGPLARLAADPSLYAGDEQLRSFENHAWLYGLIWRAAEATVGVVPAHMALTLGLTLLVGLVMLWIARAVGAAGWFVPLAFLLANVVELRGIGRGAYGGSFGDHFHLQSLAITLGLVAFLTVLRSQWLWAGVALGLAALAQPVLAFHAAFAVGCYLLTQGRSGFRPLIIVAVISMVVAAPALSSLLELEFGAAIDTERVIKDGYLWRADHHYRLPVLQFMLLGLYATMGLIAARHLALGAGLVLGLAILGALCWVFYSDAFGLHTASTLPYILDLSRSSPLLWVLASALAAAGAEVAWRTGDSITVFLIGCIAILIVILNYHWDGFAVTAMLLGLASVAGLVVRTRFLPTVSAAIGVVAAAVSVSTASAPLDRDANFRAFYEWAQEQTPKDAIFIAPPFVADIRELAQRPVWVDFRAVSMAQPDQIMLSRERHEQITPGFEVLPDVGGWSGARNWTIAYGLKHDASSIAAVLDRTQAAYFVTYQPDEPLEIAGAGLKIAYADEHVLVLEAGRP